MKRMILILRLIPLLVLGIGLVASGCAHQRSVAQDQGNGSYVTGSYLPQSVDRNGPVTNGKNDVRVIDRTNIDTSGGADVRQTLRELGATH